MTKNLIIFALTILLFIGSIWGSIADKNSLIFKDQLREKTIELDKLESRSTMEHDKVLGKTANLQETLDEKDAKIKEERGKVIELRKEKLSLQSKLAAQDATIKKFQNDITSSTIQLADARAELKKRERIALSTGDNDDCTAKLEKASRKLSQFTITQYRNKQLISSLQQESLDTAKVSQQANRVDTINKQLDISRADLLAAKKALEDSQLRLTAMKSESERAQENNNRELDSARAQIFGLEKILDQKNQRIKKISKEGERSKINMDILLSKITELQDNITTL
ncbi:MAG: hypothetical protein OEM02_15085, partial [Desulfobulbaceae bacterium]|nr:hypothetical protein [Desulfobulbaceae bacterium]